MKKGHPEYGRQEKYVFPGGAYDSSIDKDFSETALRETTEELGIDHDIIKVDHHLGFLVANMGAAVNIYLPALLI